MRTATTSTDARTRAELLAELAEAGRRADRAEELLAQVATVVARAGVTADR